jgi:hypothetical protein
MRRGVLETAVSGRQRVGIHNNSDGVILTLPSSDKLAVGMPPVAGSHMQTAWV